MRFVKIHLPTMHYPNSEPEKQMFQHCNIRLKQPGRPYVGAIISVVRMVNVAIICLVSISVTHAAYSSYRERQDTFSSERS